MMGSESYLEQLRDLPTPLYFYDRELLRATLDAASRAAGQYGYRVHYALKANFNRGIVAEMHRFGIGADCVSGGEVRRAIECGIPASEVVFAGVAKTDGEIRYGLEQGIFSFNCESAGELEVIDALAGAMGVTARIALRLNPDVDAMTHRHIATGVADSKFGIPFDELDGIVSGWARFKNLTLTGIHFHIGSQITTAEPFEQLCRRANDFQTWFERHGIRLEHLNLGGGLGIDYVDPSAHPVPDFESYFALFRRHLQVRAGQTVHFELGRSLVGQCGELLTRVLYNKVTAAGTHLALVDAGMNDLMRPALYGAVHRIENLTSAGEPEAYTVAGPICESTDVFARGVALPRTRRGDLLRIRSAGAYGRSMSSNYNLRDFPREVFSDEI
jgi:diaminopimelate decarboxylase